MASLIELVAAKNRFGARPLSLWKCDFQFLEMPSHKIFAMHPSDIMALLLECHHPLLKQVP
jgi:hypothetical protein